jgi:O-antigen/teichoic acid export membrane protein
VTTTRRVLSNISLNFVALATSAVLSFWATPVLFIRLGQLQYAVLVFAIATVTIIEAVDFGVMTTVVRFTAEYHESGEHIALRRLATTAFYLSIAAGIIFAAALWVVAAPVLKFFHLAEGHRAITAFRLICSALAFEFPGILLRSVLDGLQNFGRAAMIETAYQTVRTVGSVALLYSGFGLVAVSGIFLLSSAIYLAGMLAMSIRAIPGLGVGHPGDIRVSSLRPLRRFSLGVFVEESMRRLFLTSDIYVAARMLAAPEVALLAITRRIPWALQRFAQQGIVVGFPIATAAASQGDSERLRRYLLVTTRNVLAIALPAGIAIGIWADVLLRIWVGPEVVNGSPILRMFLVLSVFAAVQQMAVDFLMAAGKVCTTAVISGLMVGCTFTAVAYWTRAGNLLALATGLTLVQAAAAMALLRIAQRQAGLTTKNLLRSAVMPPVIAALVFGVVTFSPRLWGYSQPLVALLSVFLASCTFLVVYTRFAPGIEGVPLKNRLQHMVSHAE